MAGKKNSQEGHPEAGHAQEGHAQAAKPAEQHAQPSHAQEAKPAAQRHTETAARSTQTHTTKTVTHTTRTHMQPRKVMVAEQWPAGTISDAHYNASFGSGHSFHVNRGDYDRHRFAYGGYNFGFVQPWPVGWGYDDDVYVIYSDGGYYMYNRVHPGLRLSINIL